MFTRYSICFLFFALSIVRLFSASYYIDAQNGDNSNDGLTTGTAWQTMTKVSDYSLSPGFSGGDQILFKRGQTFSNGDYIYFRSSGSANNPIVIGAYGEGNNPCLSTINSLPNFFIVANWTDLGDNVWRMEMSSDPWRIWLNNIEYVEANTNATAPVSLLDSKYRWYHDGINGYLYVWAESNPSSYYSSASGLQNFQHEFLFYGTSYITVQDLDIVGGFYGAITIMNGSHDITIQNCKILKARHGILVQGIDADWNSRPCYNIYIKNNEIDSEANYSYNYEYFNIGEGVYFRSGVTDSEISGNIFRDWGHSAINLYADIGEGIKRCRIFNNECYAENISYGRGLGFNGATGLCEDNEMYGNLISNTTAPNQINCSELYFHDNIIDTVIRSPAKAASNAGQGLNVYINEDWPSANNNIIIGNIISNCDDVGISVLNATSSTKMSGNLIQDNIVSNCGLNVTSARSHLSGVSMEVTESVAGLITENSFWDNELNGSSAWDVFYKGTPLSTYKFNNMDGHDYNEISGNFSNMAKGKLYTMSPAPNYTLCTDSPGDTTQLSDGLYYTGTSTLWTQMPYTVGWNNRNPVITFDLGQVRQINGASFYTAGGVATVYWPSAINIEVSSDGNNYTTVGDLVSLSNTENGAPPAYGTYNVHCYKTKSLNEIGRYVRLTVTRVGTYVFADEIKILGTSNLRNIAAMKTYDVSPTPNYAYCSDSPGDNTQLTDGLYYTGTGSLWTQMPYTVGWNNTTSPTISIDLGKVRGINGVSLNTAGGSSGVYWPSEINIEVSSDGINYTTIGDLVDLSSMENGNPPAYGAYSLHHYRTEGLSEIGRYIRLTVTRVGQFVFSDEIEVLATNSFSNIAKGKSYTISPAPNYTLCTDSPGDTTQLTDGLYYTGIDSLWTRLYTVGWNNTTSPTITIDLSQSRQINGVSFYTAGGVAGVYWPSAISIEVSSDGNNYTTVGDLVSLSNTENGAPPAYGTYNVHCYKTESLNETGRYVRLTITRTGTYVFADEIKVLGN